MLENACDLSMAPLSFIESFVPNFVRTETPPVGVGAFPAKPVTDATLRLVEACLSRLDPDMAYLDWFRVAAAIHNTTGGLADGYTVFDVWSSGGDKYKGPRDTQKLWRSMNPNHPCPITMATLRRMVIEAGHSWDDVLNDAEPFDTVTGRDA